ncbi:hypothetical protein [Jatrophihabitans sp.]|uniref:hypothetical protein n=1 Tax=Jatrophihabitans sp. TaxID=1932789 RepID=UPI0030C66FE5|nr:hypothetical protein [Jatrophihabitans sp.]
MSAGAAYFLVGSRRHDALLEVLADLEAVQLGYPDELLPAAAIQLQASVWEYLKAYGRRDEHGQVDETVTPAIEPWRPSAAQLEAHAAGLPVPPDDEDQASGQRNGEVTDLVAPVGGAEVQVLRGQRPLGGATDLGLQDDGLTTGVADERGGLLGAVEGTGHAPTVEVDGDAVSRG